MYNAYFGFSREPFNNTPDPSFLYMSPSHKEALASILYGIQSRKGFVTVVGDVGTGQTTLVRSFLQDANREKIVPIYIFNPQLSSENLLKAIFTELEIPCNSHDAFWMTRKLHEVLIDYYKQGKNVVLIIDEAQNVPNETLEQIRMLSNLETVSDKLLQIVLIGQNELEDKLNRYELRQLKQRIAIRAYVRALTPDESRSYIIHRLAQVSEDPTNVFDTKAIDRIVRITKGVPRLINIVCENSLVAAFGMQEKVISKNLVKEVISDLRMKRSDFDFKGPSIFQRHGWQLATTCLLVLIIAVLMWGNLNGGFFSATNDDHVQQIALNEGTVFHEALPDPTPDESKETERVDETRLQPTPSEQEIPESPDKVVEAHRDDRVVDQNYRSGEVVLPAAGSFSPQEIAVEPVQEIAEEPVGEETIVLASNPVIKPGVVTGVDTVEANSDEVVDRPTTTEVKAVGLPYTYEVEEGDSLIFLCTEIYGFSNQQIITFVKEHNTQIKDIDFILQGDELLFPKLRPQIPRINSAVIAEKISQASVDKNNS